MLLKSTLREIKSSLGRFLAILAIIALGVGFFGGLKVTKPSMIRTLDEYLNEQKFYDYRLLSSIGFEEEDIDRLQSELQRISAADSSNTSATSPEALVPVDFSGVSATSEANSPETVCLEPAYFLDALCAIDGASESPYRLHSITSNVNTLYMIDGRMPAAANECVVDNYMADIKIGDVVTITDNNEEDTLDTLTNHDLNVVGIVRSPLYINFERGNTSIGTGKLTSFIYVTPEEFDTEYYMEVYARMAAGDRAGAFTDEYDNYIDPYSPYVEDALTAVIDERYLRIKNDAQSEIDDARKELDDKKAEAKQELADAKKELEDGAKEIEDHRIEIEDGKEEIEKAKRTLDSKQRELNNARAELDAKMAQMTAAQIAGSIPGVSDGYFSENMMADAPLGTYMTQPAAGQVQFEVAQAQLEAAQAQLAAGQKEIDSARATLKEKEKELLDGEKELNDAQRELEDGQKEYDDAVIDFNKEIADAEEKLADAQKELDDVEEPDIYCLDRNTNVGYASFEPNSDIVASVANVFPIFFFAVAVLICMTTMNRMVEEQRVQIGILKALGYSPAAIMMKYLFYAGSAALLGAVGGYILGTRFLPIAIWQGYNIMYNMGPTVKYQPVPVICICSIAAAMICALGSAYYSVIHELKEVPANLIRPKAPKSGKRIFLEYITPLWKRMKFLHKVSARNIIRYKKRFFMMILGIGGCTALVLTGFGIGDSIKGIADLQFDNIQIYDAAVTFSEGVSDNDMEEVAGISGVEDIAFMRQESVDITYNDVTKSVYAITPAKEEDLKRFLVSKDLESGEDIPYPNVASNDATKNNIATSTVADGIVGSTEAGVASDAAIGSPEAGAASDVATGSPEADGTASDMADGVAGSTEASNAENCETISALLTDNTADLIGVSKGDIIVIRDADMNEMKAQVTGTPENHFSSFLYLPEGVSSRTKQQTDGASGAVQEDRQRESVGSTATENRKIDSDDTSETEGKQVTGADIAQESQAKIEYNCAWIRLAEGQDPHAVAAEIAKRDDVMDVSVMTDLKTNVNKMMAGMDFIVLVVIMCAGALAFIVLYNLTNINITERVREIATIKVLGFYSNETAQYVFRENIILTAIGALVGLPLGRVLHAFIMYTIKIDMVSFLTYIAPISYVWAILLTFVFAIVVNFFMMFKLAKINMAESLKSIE